MYSKILITTDGSENAEKTAEHALWIANESDAEILVLNVFELYSPTLVVPFSTIPGSNQDMYEPLKKEAENISARFIEKLRSAENFNAETDITMVVRDGNPYQEIIKTVEEMNVDLIVMGASGRHGFDRIALGSVTERVVRSSKVPVMVVP
ncbi:MAG: universal stress protein [Methanobacterium sp. ERen5]|nr:MAG: universal stress protein [Methanobacterium sp. ERen5]